MKKITVKELSGACDYCKGKGEVERRWTDQVLGVRYDGTAAIERTGTSTITCPSCKGAKLVLLSREVITETEEEA